MIRRLCDYFTWRVRDKRTKAATDPAGPRRNCRRNPGEDAEF